MMHYCPTHNITSEGNSCTECDKTIIQSTFDTIKKPQPMIPNDIKEKIKEKAKSYYKTASIGNKFKTMHELGFNRGAEFTYQLAQEELTKKDERNRELENRLEWQMKQCMVKDERNKQLEEALKWYADSANYLAATNYPDDGINSDGMLATAYCQRRIENKAKKLLNH